MSAGWWTQNWGNVASVAGLLVSVVAWILSRQAKASARRALRTVEVRTFAQELRASMERVNMLSVLCGNSDWAAAAREAHEVLQKLTIACHRWPVDPDVVTGEALNLVVDQLEIVRTQAARFSKKKPSTKEVEIVQKSLGRINERLAAEVGRYERLSDMTTSEST